MRTFTIQFFICLFIISIGQSYSQEIVSVSMLTDKIILFDFDEGYMDHPNQGQPIGTINPFKKELNISQASNTINYSISSTQDAAYATAKNPSTINRKTKADDFANVCQGWGNIPFYNKLGCLNTSNDHIKVHQLYLTLSTSLSSGKSYSLVVTNAAFNGSKTFNFTYNNDTNKSPVFHVNNIAYSTEAAEKYGYLYYWMGDGGSLNLAPYASNNFELVNSKNGNVVYTGNIAFRKAASNVETYQNNANETPNKNFSQADVYECNFSSYNVAGSYYIRVNGIGRSNEFNISCNAMRTPFEYVMKGIFNNRSGIAINNPHTEALRPAPHNPILTPGFSGKLKYTTTTLCQVSAEDASKADSALWMSGLKGDLTNTWGWYQDAGDWDGYSRHMEIPIGLMFTYEHFPQNFSDGQLAIPESGNGLPDILDEARWLIRFYKRLKTETEAKSWSTGGIGGARIFGDLWGADLGPNDIVRGSWEDVDRTWIVSGEDPVMTFMYAGACAQYAYLLTRDNLTDPENINWLTEAQNAFTWANNNYSPTYACYSYNIKWAKNFAAGALYRATQNTSYHNEFISSWNDTGSTSATDLYAPDAYGAYIYSATTAPTNATILSNVKSIIEKIADFVLLEISDDRACRWGGNPYMPMLVGQSTTPLIFEGMMGYAMIKNSNPTKAAEYKKVMHNTSDYFLGTNPLGMTWITGLGENNPKGILHLDSWATGDDGIKTGIVPYGPWLKIGYNTLGPWDNQWPYQHAYPNIDSWPGHERWFDQRYSGIGAEYTIDRNNLFSATIYGALSGPINCTQTVNDQQVEFKPIDNIVIYPNPFSGEFIVKGEIDKYDLSIVNQMGQVILVLPSQGNYHVVNTSNLGSGLYFLKIVADNGKVTMRHLVKM
jgi:endoglucanase